MTQVSKIASSVFKASLLGIALFLPFWRLGVNICTILFVISFILGGNWNERWLTLKKNPVFWLAPMLFIVSALGILYSTDTGRALKDLETKIPLLLIPLCFGSLKTIDQTTFIQTLKAFILSCLLASLYCIIVAVMNNINDGYTIGYIIDKLQGNAEKIGKYEWFNYEYFTYGLFTDKLNIQPIYFSLFVTLAAYFSIWIAWDNYRNNIKKFKKSGIALFFFFF